jgi:hypothetical protein
MILITNLVQLHLWCLHYVGMNFIDCIHIIYVLTGSHWSWVEVKLWPTVNWPCKIPYPSTKAWDLAFSRAIYNPMLLSPVSPPPHPSILNSEFHSSFLSHLVFLRSLRWLLVTARVVPSSPILVTLMKEALSSSETSILTRATWCNIPEDTILHSQLASQSWC